MIWDWVWDIIRRKVDRGVNVHVIRVGRIQPRGRGNSTAGSRDGAVLRTRRGEIGGRRVGGKKWGRSRTGRGWRRRVQKSTREIRNIRKVLEKLKEIIGKWRSLRGPDIFIDHRIE
jgi:hypothetical protein